MQDLLVDGNTHGQQPEALWCTCSRQVQDCSQAGPKPNPLCRASQSLSFRMQQNPSTREGPLGLHCPLTPCLGSQASQPPLQVNSLYFSTRCQISENKKDLAMPNCYTFKIYIIEIQTIHSFPEVACQQIWKTYKINTSSDNLCILSYIIKHLTLKHGRSRKKMF